MNNLFSVFKNHLFLNLYQILRDLNQGVPYTVTEVHDRLYSPMAYHPVIEDLISQIMTIFFAADGQQARSRFSLPLPDLAATLPEKEWLKTVLSDKTCQPFLTEALHEKLEKALEGVDVLPMPAVFDSPDLSQAGVKDSLRTFQDALWQQRKLELSVKGEEKPGLYSPCVWNMMQRRTISPISFRRTVMTSGAWPSPGPKTSVSYRSRWQKI